MRRSRYPPLPEASANGRNLLYTAVTGGTRLVILVGTKKTSEMGVRMQDTTRRYTALRQRLQEV
jgi:ATP-dependent exoDNAse (exonuclease V) alpha subunit